MVLLSARSGMSSLVDDDRLPVITGTERLEERDRLLRGSDLFRELQRFELIGTPMEETDLHLLQAVESPHRVHDAACKKCLYWPQRCEVSVHCGPKLLEDV